MRNFFFALVTALLVTSTTHAQSKIDSMSVQTNPDHLFYLLPDQYSQLQKNLSPAPAPDSDIQKSDLATILRLQESRSPEDCKRASSEVALSLDGFFGAPYGPLTKTELDEIRPLMNKVFDDSVTLINRLKVIYPRKRPYDYEQHIHPCVKREITMSYPSGHTGLSEVEALVAAKIFPKKAAQLKAHAQEIGNDRVLGGVHYPSDVAAGRKIGDMLFTMFEQSPKFQSDLKEILKVVK